METKTNPEGGFATTTTVPSDSQRETGAHTVEPAKVANEPATTDEKTQQRKVSTNVLSGDEEETVDGEEEEEDGDVMSELPAMKVVDLNLEDHVRFERANSLFDTDLVPRNSTGGGELIASVITGKTVDQLKRGSLQATYYDGTLIAGAPRKKNILTASTFLEADESVQQESYDIAPILGGDTPDDELQPEKFGTWDGVWARCMANIFGVIMFLRTGWVVGQAGIGLACVIILLSGFITTLTTMSMSAIATNGQVKGGGAYFLISRSVGPSLGGSIGILFTLGLTLGVALYTIGFCETMVSQLGVASTGSTCLSCYGANIFDSSEEVEPECCNSCSNVTAAYELRNWTFDTDNFIQCQGIPIVIVPQPEPILQLADSYVDNVRIWGVIVNIVLLIMILVGIGWIVRLQAVFLAIIIVSMVSVVIGGAVGPSHWLHSWNNNFTLAPGFTGIGNETCTNTTQDVTDTTCNDFEGWEFVFNSTRLQCRDFNTAGSFNHLCDDPSNTIFGTFNSSCTSVQEACCDCGGGTEERTFTEICSEYVDNFFANLGPQFTCDGPSENFYNGSPGSCWDFFTVFGIFFPAVTGIMAGANISNLLQKPAVNLPVGTFHSIAWSTVGYIVLAVVVGASATRAELIGNYFLMQYMDITIFLVPLGVYCATFSSALASLVGAPQLLAAVAADKLIPCLNIFAVTHHRVGFCPRRSRRTGRVVFCFRRAPYVTDNLHVFFARRVKLYLYRHVLNNVVQLSGLERRVSWRRDLPHFFFFVRLCFSCWFLCQNV